MDFGLARRDGTGEQQLTHTGPLVGTPRYMAPEQVAGKPDAIGPGCDVYALGVILYELLTGRPPFSGDMLAVLSQITTAQPAPPSSRRPELDAELDLICLKAMAKQPRNRFGSMAEMAQSLSEYIRTSASQGAAAIVSRPALAAHFCTGKRNISGPGASAVPDRDSLACASCLYLSALRT